MSYSLELKRLTRGRVMARARTAVRIGAVGQIPTPPEAELILLNESGAALAQWSGLCAEMRELKERILHDLDRFGHDEVHERYVAEPVSVGSR